MMDIPLPLQGFITGSHAYGKPGPSSDIDFVVLVSKDTKEFFEKQMKEKTTKKFRSIDLFAKMLKPPDYHPDRFQREYLGNPYPPPEVDGPTQFEKDHMCINCSGTGVYNTAHCQDCDGTGSTSPYSVIRFGDLNLVCTTTFEEYNFWKDITEMLIRRKDTLKRPIRNEEAVYEFHMVRFDGKCDCDKCRSWRSGDRSSEKEERLRTFWAGLSSYDARQASKMIKRCTTNGRERKRLRNAAAELCIATTTTPMDAVVAVIAVYQGPHSNVTWD